MLFLRMFLGNLMHISPIAFLILYPFKENFRWNKIFSIHLLSLTVFLSSATYAVACCIFKRISPPNTRLFVQANTIELICLIPCLIIFLLCIKAHWTRKVFVFFFNVSNAFMLLTVSNILSLKLPGSSYGKYTLPYYPNACISIGIMYVIFLPLIFILLKKLYMPIANNLPNTEHIYISLLSVFASALLITMLSIDSDFNYTKDNKLALFYVSFLIIILSAYFVCFRMFKVMNASMIAEKNLLNAKHQLEIHDEQYKHISLSIEKIRTIKHDLRHHIIVLENFINNDEFDKVKAYIKEYNTYLNQVVIHKISDNDVVNIILNYYKIMADNYHIQFNTKINIPREVGIENTDISIVLGNIIENAVDACKSLGENGFININMICQGNMLVITVDNNYEKTLSIKDNEYQSTKTKHSGLGLKSVTSISEKYLGGTKFSHTDNIFHTSIMLNMDVY